jgi:hydrocephalus-inducing protein
VDLTISGQGIPLNLDLKDPDQAQTDMGIISVGGNSARTVPLINRSTKAVKFQIKPENPDQFEKAFLSINPDDREITLKPKETFNIEVKFRPKVRLPNFEQDIMIQIDGLEDPKKLFSVFGAAHGIELKIMDEVISFGQVVKDSRLTKTLQMSNFGDVKANFEWDASKFSENFTISPAKGYVNPNSNLDMEVTFHPKYVDASIAQKVTCTVQGGEPIKLTMMGKCVAHEGSQTQELNFQTVVRKPTTQSIPI